jgi:hypothetical protein
MRFGDQQSPVVMLDLFKHPLPLRLNGGHVAEWTLKRVQDDG